MKTNFNKALELVLKHEGGWANHPADPGGATMKGVTQRVYTAYRSRKGLPNRSVRHIEKSELQDIYKKQYWDAVCADDLPSGLDYAMFDYAVNSGPVRAIKDLQRVMGGKVDGHLGQATIVAALRKDTLATILALCDRRMSFLRSLKTFSVFGKGWTTRVNGVRKVAGRMAGIPHHTEEQKVSKVDQPVEPVEPVEEVSTGKAEEADVKPSKKDGFFEKVATGVGTAGAGIAAVLQDIDWRVGIAIVVVAAVAGTAYMVFSKSKGE